MRKKSQEKNHAVMPLVGVEFGDREKKNGRNKSSYLSFFRNVLNKMSSIYIIPQFNYIILCSKEPFFNDI